MVQATDLVPEKAEGDTMNLVVFGANGPTGQLLTKQALAEGHAVTAVTRHPEAFPLRDARLRVLRGDVFDRCRLRKRLPDRMPSSRPWVCLTAANRSPCTPKARPISCGP
jgi:nucleoside-diphosphate-sugar epimerase